MDVEPNKVSDRFAVRFCAGVTLAVLIGLIGATLAYEWRELRTFQISYPYPMSVYNLIYVPGTSPVPQTPGAAGADFSQVYTSALALRHGESPYRPTTDAYKDRWGRPPGYPPLTNWLALPYSFLSYVNAYFLHTVLSVLGLLTATTFVLWKAGLIRHIGRVMLVQVSLYLLTPIGFTHMERGQFDLVVATADVLAVGVIFLGEDALVLAVLVGFLGALKWTSVSFLCCFSALGFVLGSGRRRWAFFLIPVVLTLATFPFWRGLKEYWTTIQIFEINATPYGLTLQYLMPRAWARAAPVVLTLSVAGFACFRCRSAADRALALTRVSAPFSMALMNLAVCFGTLSYEYHTVTTLAMIPGLVLWIEKASGVANSMKAVTCITFGTFLVIAFRVFGIGTNLTPEGMTLVYAVFAVLFFGISLAVIDQPTAREEVQI